LEIASNLILKILRVVFSGPVNIVKTKVGIKFASAGACVVKLISGCLQMKRPAANDHLS
jgi:hypothetical protein